MQYSHETEKECLERITVGRILALREQPYLRHIVMSLRPVMNSDPHATFSVDIGWNLHYNPKFLLSLSPSEVAASIIHEAYHILYNHSGRFVSNSIPFASAELWNEAADAVINSDLIESGTDFGRLDVIIAGKYAKYPHWKKGSTTEELFYSSYKGEAGSSDSEGTPSTKDDIPNSQSDSSKEQEEQSGSSADSQEDSSETFQPEQEDTPAKKDKGLFKKQPKKSSDNDKENQDSEPELSSGEELGNGNVNGVQNSEKLPEQGEKEFDDKDKQENQSHDCGSAVDGKERSWESKAVEEDRRNNPEHGDEITPEEQEQIVKKAIQDVFNAEGRRPGSTPKGLFETIKNYNTSRTDWRKALRKIVNKKVAATSGARNYTYSRPSRRHQASNIYMPSIRGYKQPTIIFVLDTSGSMRPDMLSQSLAEMDKILKSVNIKSVDIIQCDTKPKLFSAVSDLKNFEVWGRGGTNMIEGIQAAADMTKKAADVVIVVTDGYTPWPATPPKKLKRATFIACIVRKQSRIGGQSESDIISKVNAPAYMSVVPVLVK